MSEETVQAKHAFEQLADQCGVKILHYHTDHGRFADNAFIQDCKTQCQSLSYCGVNTHFHSREMHPGPTRTDQDLHAVCNEQVEENDPDLLVAICHEACQQRCQCYTKEGRGQLAIGKILGSESRAETETLSCFWMPYLSTG